MEEILNNLKINTTNGIESFCMISENQLNALKELARRYDEELERLKNEKHNNR